MNSEVTAFAYDDFEQYLLDAAAIDEAPADLPHRLSVALGAGVPILAATQLISLAPTTTSLHGALGASGSVAPTGLFGTLKASLGVGATTLWGTAVKGIVVGLIAGTGLIGTGRALGSLSGVDAPPPNQLMVSRKPNANTPREANQAQAALVPDPQHSATEQSLGFEQFSEPSEQTSHKPLRAYFSDSTSWRVGSEPSQAELPEVSDKGKRRAAWKFPEKTYAVARYPTLLDDVVTDVSAYYDTPKRHAPPAVASFEPEPNVTPAEVLALRAQTVQRSRLLLGQSRAAAALAELNEYRTRVGSRNFGLDELLLRIESLAVLGRAKEAQADVATVERLAPNSAALRQAQQLANSRFVR